MPEHVGLLGPVMSIPRALLELRKRNAPNEFFPCLSLIKNFGTVLPALAFISGLKTVLVCKTQQPFVSQNIARQKSVDAQGESF